MENENDSMVKRRHWASLKQSDVVRTFMCTCFIIMRLVYVFSCVFGATISHIYTRALDMRYFPKTMYPANLKVQHNLSKMTKYTHTQCPCLIPHLVHIVIKN
ncbi:hypothetical protein NP493_453g03043 [Ridgeia piscesae]|uniref:Uncharacterized protein n=1 Tax=Ridgeia piscesae TaxID=27915 RepID=A0AAD9KZM2_RIDPI|nr:hypothetical protein NP493_453g03043 [Ridgeia piscesae]